QFASDLDASTQKLLARGERLTELLKQPQYTPFPVEEQVVVIFAGVNGYLDGIEVGDITRFEQTLIDEIRDKSASLLKTIRDEGAISENTETRLNDFLEDFVKNFV
ncbi:MAG: F0F1 ATP synthase subunit alpha, partial [Alphaproteobacteria bacterium]|nr:F0F1 ATP synthase subunit alpha [Alphaproteobacteria bacterium]